MIKLRDQNKNVTICWIFDMISSCCLKTMNVHLIHIILGLSACAVTMFAWFTKWPACWSTLEFQTHKSTEFTEMGEMKYPHRCSGNTTWYTGLSLWCLRTTVHTEDQKWTMGEGRGSFTWVIFWHSVKWLENIVKMKKGDNKYEGSGGRGGA